MRSIRLSLIITVLNEQDTILQFIESVFNQSKLPDEFIIVDGGSTDTTVSVISRFRQDFGEQANKQIKFKFIVKKGNRSVGRNEAIRNARGEIILCSDSGCVLDKDWIKNIAKPFENKSVDVVAGYCKGLSNNIFQKCLMPYVLVMEDRINKAEFLPATRSMAFRKNIWNQIGGFDEKFSHNEDYIFANKLKTSYAKIVFAKNAIVYWIPRKSIIGVFIMFFRFAFGDAEAGKLRPKVFLIFARYLLGIYVLLLSFVEKSGFLVYGLIFSLVFYVVWSIFKNYRYVKDIRAFFFLPLLQLTSDISVLLGTTIGHLNHKKERQ